jgi:hypothetical protein
MKKRIAQILSGIALAGTIVPPALFFCGRLDLPATQQWMLGAAILWFLSAPFWMEHKATGA